MANRTGNLAGIAFLIAVLALVSIYHQGAAERTAPAITFPLIDGRELPLSELAGKAVLVTFWASTCIECVKEMPDLTALYRELSGSGFEIIGVAMPYDPPNRVLETSRRMKLPYPVALDIHAAAVTAFGDVAVTPSSFLISPAGRIVMTHTGRWDIERLRERVQELLSTTS